MARGDEARVQAVFEEWLVARGWSLRGVAERGHVDVDAVHRDGRRLLAEVKGATAATGTDVDTAYGQLLRRMTDEERTSYAVVVPEGVATTAARRVPDRVRRTLGIALYSVTSEGAVHGPV
ncbi:hypothetical protein [Streptomyces sp. NBC_00503]|uniref:hypothetical protein n=1 Tax=Streptomyces sp. NBC_00503 TaxID=2903659 RepID=UPI002E7FFE39|nr:hypothetical protein [Streptomyces sp. NBC_00503]WUD81209.1 hypothetical protein OG490_12025 [Streptomyces sp. NBC_00503]